MLILVNTRFVLLLHTPVINLKINLRCILSFYDVQSDYSYRSKHHGQVSWGTISSSQCFDSVLKLKTQNSEMFPLCPITL